jgi:hypothetical protein
MMRFIDQKDDRPADIASYVPAPLVPAQRTNIVVDDIVAKKKRAYQ